MAKGIIKALSHMSSSALGLLFRIAAPRNSSVLVPTDGSLVRRIDTRGGRVEVTVPRKLLSLWGSVVVGGRRVYVLNSAKDVNARTLSIVRRRDSLCRMCYLATGGEIGRLTRRTRGFRPTTMIITGRTRCSRLGGLLDSRPSVGICTNTRTLYSVIRTRPVSVILTSVMNFSNLRPAVRTVGTHGGVYLTGGRALIITNRLVYGLTRRCRIPVLPISDRRDTVFRDLINRNSGRMRGLLLAYSNNPFHGFARRRLRGIATTSTLGRPA